MGGAPVIRGAHVAAYQAVKIERVHGEAIDADSLGKEVADEASGQGKDQGLPSGRKRGRLDDSLGQECEDEKEPQDEHVWRYPHEECGPRAGGLLALATTEKDAEDRGCEPCAAESPTQQTPPNIR
jgi:hypothetical protein